MASLFRQLWCFGIFEWWGDMTWPKNGVFCVFNSFLVFGFVCILVSTLVERVWIGQVGDGTEARLPENVDVSIFCFKFENSFVSTVKTQIQTHDGWKSVFGSDEVVAAECRASTPGECWRLEARPKSFTHSLAPVSQSVSYPYTGVSRVVEYF